MRDKELWLDFWRKLNIFWELQWNPTYAAIDEPMTVTTGGSEAIISDILATQDPRELTLSEVGERRPGPSEMRAGLLAGFQSF